MNRRTFFGLFAVAAAAKSVPIPIPTFPIISSPLPDFDFRTVVLPWEKDVDLQFLRTMLSLDGLYSRGTIDAPAPEA